MIKIAYSNIESLNLNEVYELLPESRKRKVDNLRFEKDKKLSAGAFILLNKLLEEKNITHPLFESEKYGKPYILNYPNIYFNLSHSDKIVTGAISDREIGIDVEYNDCGIDLNIAKHYFHNSEYENIRNSKNPSDEFFKYWVLKESYMKYTGLGFNLDLNSFEIVIEDEIRLKNDENNLKFNLFDIDDYKLGVCSEYNVKKVFEYSVDELDIKEGLK